MTGSASSSPRGSGLASAAPQSYLWPLVALVLVMLPQVLVPARMREAPSLIVPIIEATVVLVRLDVAARPGPVRRSARPLILSLFAVLILTDTAAAVRLVALVIRSTPKAKPPALP